MFLVVRFSSSKPVHVTLNNVRIGSPVVGSIEHSPAFGIFTVVIRIADF